MKPKELTVRGLILGALITTVFTAANVYLGLKVGLTFASSIPAAVISMAILSVVKDSSILENNIVQTVASAAGTLSAIIFVLPGLVIVGWWTGFPFWQSFLICLSGGVLGVLFTIPLRRALVTNSDLPYPEGVAAAEVLKVGAGTRGEATDESGESKEGLRAIILGSVASAGFAIITATRIAAAEVTDFFRVGATASTGYNIAFSLALLGVGQLVGLSVGMAMLVGLVISWVVAVPWLTAIQPAPADVTLAAHTLGIWRTQVRFIGAGTIGVAAIYSLARLAKPVVGGLMATLASRAADHTDDLDRDISPPWIYALTAVCLVIAGYLAYTFASASVLSASTAKLTAIAVPFVLLAGFLIAGVCGYMAGLVGASRMGERVALVVGVLAGPAPIPPVLNLLAKAYGFAGAANVGAVSASPLPAPQATLISALAQGVVGGNLDWKMIGIGALVGLGIIAIDEALGAAKRLRLPPLAVRRGVYLPMWATFAVVVGTLTAKWYERRTRGSANPERTERLGTLVASGLIVGESLWGVLNAGLIVAFSKEAPIGLVPDDFALAPWLGVLGFVGVIVWLYTWMARRSMSVR